MPDPLDEVLRRAQDLGLLGPGPIGAQRAHAELLARIALAATGEGRLRWLDLGSGGGLPGLAVARLLAEAGRAAEGVLLDSQRRRTAFLRQAVTDLGWGGSVEVVTDRAEAAARSTALREHFDLVIARSFGPPAVTAECAVGLLRPGGLLVVSEPPDEPPDRWDDDRLAELGLAPPRIRHEAEPDVAISVALIARLPRPLDARWPRKPGRPAKRPLW